MINDFDPASDTVNLDIAAAFAGLQAADITSAESAKIGTGTDEVDESACIQTPLDQGSAGRWCVIGERYGVQCHSASKQSACASLFPNFGLDLATGAADAASNLVFSKKP